MDSFVISLQIRNAFAYVFGTHSVHEKAPVVDLQGVYTNLRRVCKDMGLKIDGGQVANYSKDGDNVTMGEFLKCIDHGLSKVELNGEHCLQIERFLWQTSCRDHYRLLQVTIPLFTEEDAFILWRIFNRLSVNAQLGEAEMATMVDRFVETVGVRINGFIHARRQSLGGGVQFFPLLERINDSIPETVETRVVGGIIRRMEDELIGQVIKAGLLNKKGHVRRTWKERWFVLKPGVLHYYLDEHCAVQKGVICINAGTRLENADSKSGHHFRFLVVCGKTSKVFEIDAYTEADRLEWTQALFSVMHSNGKSPMEMEIIARKKGCSGKMWGSPNKQRANQHLQAMEDIGRTLAIERCSVEISRMEGLNDCSSESDSEVFENTSSSPVPAQKGKKDLATKLRDLQEQHEKLQKGLATLEQDYRKDKPKKNHST